jgi:uncharacterized protein involved in exopolysaccharide biosynthesis
MNPRTPRSGESPVEIDLIGIYYTIRRQAWILLSCMGLSLFLGVVYLWWTPKIYEGQAMIQVGQAERKVVKIDGIDSENLESAESLKTLEQNLSNWPLLEQVVRNP